MSNPFRYAGEVFDAESGMIYLRARYYDPSVGRFISEDTYKGQVDNPLSLNRYTYGHNNPLRFIDPSGHIAAEGSGGTGENQGWLDYTISKIRYWDISTKTPTPEEQAEALMAFNAGSSMYLSRWAPPNVSGDIGTISRPNVPIKAVPTKQYSQPAGPVLPSTKSGYVLTGHSFEQLGDKRFNGKLSLDRLDELLQTKNPAYKIIDTRSGNTNIYVNSEYSSSSLLRITIPSDGGKRIISIGFEPMKRIDQFIEKGTFKIID